MNKWMSEWGTLCATNSSCSRTAWTFPADPSWLGWWRAGGGPCKWSEQRSRRGQRPEAEEAEEAEEDMRPREEWRRSGDGGGAGAGPCPMCDMASRGVAPRPRGATRREGGEERAWGRQAPPSSEGSRWGSMRSRLGRAFRGGWERWVAMAEREQVAGPRRAWDGGGERWLGGAEAGAPAWERRLPGGPELRLC